MYPVESMNYRHTVVRCGHCRNHEERNPTWPRMRHDEIQRRGWQVLTKVRDTDKDAGGWKHVQRPDPVRTPGMQHIERSLPANDRDEDIPF